MAGGLLLSGAIAALLTSALPAQSPSPGFVDPPPDKIVIKVATVNGSGCPQGTAAVAVSGGSAAFTATDETDWVQLVHAPCGVQRSFNINTELRVDAGARAADKISFIRCLRGDPRASVGGGIEPLRSRAGGCDSPSRRIAVL